MLYEQQLEEQLIAHAWHFCTRNCTFEMSQFFSLPRGEFGSLGTNLSREKFLIFLRLFLVRVFLKGDKRVLGRKRVSRGSI